MCKTDKIFAPIGIALFIGMLWVVGSSVKELKKEEAEADKQKALNNPEMLFTYGKDCTMYRFYDKKSYHYFSDCGNTAQLNIHEHSVK